LNFLFEKPQTLASTLKPKLVFGCNTVYVGWAYVWTQSYDNYVSLATKTHCPKLET